MEKYRRRIPAYLLIAILSISIFSLAVSATGTESKQAQAHQGANSTAPSSSYAIRPILNDHMYNLNEEIPLQIGVWSDSPILTFSCVYDGFAEQNTLRMEDTSIVGSIVCNATAEEAQFKIVVTLENGKVLTANVFGFVVDGRVYINVNSMYAARNLYWSHMLDIGVFTKMEYEAYMAGRVPDTSLNMGQIEDGTASTMATTYNITISGTLQWQDDWGNSHPLQYTKVTVMDEGGGLLGLWDTELGTTYTNVQGYYTLSFQNKGACDPYLKVYPEGVNTVVKTGAGSDYVWETDALENVTTNQTLSRTISMSHAAGPAFQISQAVISAAKFVQLVYTTDIDPVTVKYPHQENYANTYYENETIFIEDPSDNAVTINENILRSYASWDVIQHEFFHHVQHQLGITENPGGWHAISINMYTHYMAHRAPGMANEDIDFCKGACAKPEQNQEKDFAIKLVYAEAVATILSGIAQDYLVNGGLLDSNIKTVGDACYTAYNGAVFDYEDAAVRMGEVNETSVAAILWDIYDDDVDSSLSDTISLGYANFWKVLVKENSQNQKSKTFSDFIQALYSTSSSYKESIGEILWFYGFAPKYGEMSTCTLETLPTISWTANGSDDPSYQNNAFEIVFLDQYKLEILRISTTSMSYTLTETEWNTILSDSADHFYWTIGGIQKGGNNCTTGPYYCQYTRTVKPTGSPVNLTIENSQSATIQNVETYHWYKFVAPTSGTYNFYTTSQIDTIGDLFSKPIYGLGESYRLAYNDDIGDEDYNFCITYNLAYQQVVYIRVRGYNNSYGTGNYTLVAELLQHIHDYTAEYVSIDGDTHRCVCDCGLYEIEEHDWRNPLPNKAYCIYCKYTLNGNVPGGSISSIGDDEVVDTMICVAMPTETNAKDEE